MTPALRLENVNAAYNDTIVLSDVTFEIPEGFLVAIVGPNGAGKTTMLKTIIDAMPSSGTISLYGDATKAGRKRLTYVPQRTEIDWDFPLTVSDVVLKGRSVRLGLFARLSKEDQAKANNALSAVSMLEFADRQIGELSGGQRQRVFLARAIAHDGDLFLMDEPFQGVDAATETAIVNVLRSLRDAGKTVVVVHHDLSTVTTYFDWVVLLNKTIMAVGPTNEVFTAEMAQKTYGGRLATFADDKVLAP